jgi:hypothetical protein
MFYNLIILIFGLHHCQEIDMKSTISKKKRGRVMCNCPMHLTLDGTCKTRKDDCKYTSPQNFCRCAYSNKPHRPNDCKHANSLASFVIPHIMSEPTTKPLDDDYYGKFIVELDAPVCMCPHKSSPLRYEIVGCLNSQGCIRTRFGCTMCQQRRDFKSHILIHVKGGCSDM